MSAVKKPTLKVHSFPGEPATAAPTEHNEFSDDGGGGYRLALRRISLLLVVLYTPAELHRIADMFQDDFAKRTNPNRSKPSTGTPPDKPWKPA